MCKTGLFDNMGLRDYACIGNFSLESMCLLCCLRVIVWQPENMRPRLTRGILQNAHPAQHSNYYSRNARNHTKIPCKAGGLITGLAPGSKLLYYIYRMGWDESLSDCQFCNKKLLSDRTLSDKLLRNQHEE